MTTCKQCGQADHDYACAPDKVSDDAGATPAVGAMSELNAKEAPAQPEDKGES